MDKAKDLYITINGTEEGFEAAFSPGADVDNMRTAELFQRLNVSSVRPFHISEHVKAPDVYHQRLIEIFDELEAKNFIQTVDESDVFGACASLLLEHLDLHDGPSSPSRPPALVLERCRRGGKTFMLTAVSKTLAQRLMTWNEREVYVVPISLNSTTPFQGYTETAVDAIYSRIAYFIVAPDQPFDVFRKKYSTFDSVARWLYENNVILLIDELNVIPNTCKNYTKMSMLLDQHVGGKGGALLYSTHHRITEDLLRGRTSGAATELSLRSHTLMEIPLIETKECLVPNGNFQFGFWSAVLRGRIPALVCLPAAEIVTYAPDGSKLFTERQVAMGAVLEGNPKGFEAGRDLFRSYCYRTGRDEDTSKKPMLLWPPFMIAQFGVLGKDIQPLRSILESPDANEPMAFEALVQLSVIVRLLSHSDHSHPLVPRHRMVTNDSCFQATEVIHVHQDCQDIPSVQTAVEEAFAHKKGVQQVVAIPLYGQFPTYDFFLLHRPRARVLSFGTGVWKLKVGYQCKMGRKYPDKEHVAVAKRLLPLSVWVEGAPPSSRRSKEKDSHGWKMMNAQELESFLGKSFFHTLPKNIPE